MGFHKATSHFPDTFKDVEVKNFLEEYYEISNNRDAHEDYHQLFTDDAVFMIGSEKVKGRSEILALRKKIWENIPNRDHRAIRIFPFGNSGEELMVYGTVDYNYHDGAQKGTEWAARVKLAREEKKLKMSLYHVFLDSAG